MAFEMLHAHEAPFVSKLECDSSSNSLAGDAIGLAVAIGMKGNVWTDLFLWVSTCDAFLFTQSQGQHFLSKPIKSRWLFRWEYDTLGLACA